MDWGIILGIVGVFGIPLALAILGLTMVAKTPGEFRFVRGCFYAAAAISTITIFLLLWNYTEGSEAMRVLTAAFAGAIIFAGVAIAIDWVDKKEGVDSTNGLSNLDGSIQITADQASYPTVLPQNKIFELQLNNHFTLNGGEFISWSLPAGSILPTRDPAIAPSWGTRLRIANYGKVAVVNATVTFPIAFRAIEKIPNGTQSGAVIKSSEVTTPPFSIGAGDFVDIYAMNFSTDAYGEVAIPTIARGYIPGSNKEETFKLIAPPRFSSAGVPPFVPKSPPVPPPPTPSPPSKQGKK